MTGTFVYGLWGNPELMPRRAKILEEIEQWLQTDHRPEPWEVYVYGENNRDWLADRGVPCTMLHPDPLVDFYGVGGPPEPWGHGQMAWGRCCTWRHKTGIMQAAIKQHRTIVWLDWDTILTQPLPADFWTRMGQAQPIQMSIIRYRRPRCYWRADRAAKRSVPEGAFIYCRDRSIISRVNRKYDKHRDLVDQELFGNVMDEMAGGWPGDDGYKAMGFEPYCHHIYSQIHQPETVVFRTGGRITPEKWERRHAAKA